MPGGAEASGQVMLGAFLKALGMCLSSRVEVLFKGCVAGTVWPERWPLPEAGLPSSRGLCRGQQRLAPGASLPPLFPPRADFPSSRHCSLVFTPSGSSLDN